MSKRHFVFQVGLLIVLGLLYCAPGWATTVPGADCVLGGGPVATSGNAITIGPVTFTGSCKFRFPMHAFELGASATLPCTISVTATTVSPNKVQKRLNNTLATLLPLGSVVSPVVYPGFNGVELYTVTVSSPGSCPINSGEQYTEIIFPPSGTTIPDPRVARCETSCFLGLTGYWPFGSDPIGDGTDSTSDFFAVNLTQTTDPTKAVTFCPGWLPPLPPNTSPANPFVVGNNTRTAPMKFEVTLINHTCPPATSSDTNPNMQVIISVAQIDVAPLVIKNPLPSGSSRTLPLFTFSPPIYTYTLDLTGYACGLYSVTATPLGGEMDAQTAFFRIQCP